VQMARCAVPMGQFTENRTDGRTDTSECSDVMCLTGAVNARGDPHRAKTAGLNQKEALLA
jgi:hypothetical protein